MERGILFTGIGGQGIQLAARTLAEAAIADGRHAQLFASYGGMMRGGNSDAFLVLADARITAPPAFGDAWAAVVMHHEHAPTLWPKLATGSLAAVNTTVVPPSCRPEADVVVVEIPALQLATDLGAPMTASLVLTAALVAASGLVDPESLVSSAARVLPPYRSDAAAANARGLEAGLAATAQITDAWAQAVAT